MVGIPDGGFFAIKQMLQQQMQVAIDLYIYKLALAANGVTGVARLTPEAIPMHRKQDYRSVLYRCAIALKLANVCHPPRSSLHPLVSPEQGENKGEFLFTQEIRNNFDSRSAVDLATSLVDCLRSATQDTASQVVLNFTIEVVPPGWIDFHLTDQGIAVWLQHLTNLTHLEAPVETGQPKFVHGCYPSLFPIQYAHARCCSLLRLGHREGLIALETFRRHVSTDNPDLVWQVVDPDPIPWMNGQGQLHLLHPASQRLISEMLGLLDELGCSVQPSGAKLAHALSQAFENFYSSCRIFGEVKTQTPQLAQARLGLVAVTGSLLRSLLQDRLGVCAPEEL